jgi:branched-chain amino acid transport system permease protein
MDPITSILTQALHGLVYGMLLFLVASGFTLVFSMMGVLNITHAAFYMLGAYCTYTITIYSGNFWASLLIAPVVVGVLGMLVERFMLRQAHKGGHIAELLLTFGMFYVLAEFVRLIWGTNSLRVPMPSLLAGAIPLLGRTYPVYRLFILGFSILVLIGMACLLLRTRTGILVRAAVSDAQMVDALGTNVSTLFIGVFGGGAALAALAGVIAAPFLSVYPGMGMDVLLDCFVVIIVGGLGSLLGALVASLMLGELQSFGILLVPQLALVLQFFLMAVILVARPSGLFGEKH